MKYDLNEGDYGKYKVKGVLNDVRVTSKEVDVNMFQILSEEYITKFFAGDIDMTCNVKFLLGGTPSGSMVTVEVFSADISGIVALLGTYSYVTKSAANGGSEFTLSADVPMKYNGYNSHTLIERYIKFKVTHNDTSVVLGEYRADLTRANVLDISFSYLQSVNAMNFVITGGNEIANLNNITVIYNMPSGATQTQSITRNSGGQFVGGSGMENKTRITISTVTYGSSTQWLESVVYLRVVETGSPWIYVNMDKPNLSYNADENELEWDDVGAEEYEIFRNNEKIATVPAASEVKTS